MRGVKRRPPSLCQGIWSDPPSRILRKNLLTACLWSFNLQRQKRTRFCCLSHSACRALSPATLGNECGRSPSVWATVTRGILWVSQNRNSYFTHPKAAKSKSSIQFCLLKVCFLAHRGGLFLLTSHGALRSPFIRPYNPQRPQPSHVTLGG